MQPVSNVYKDYLKQDFLDTNYHSQLTLGVINQEAQKTAIILDTNTTIFSMTNVFDDKQVQIKYGSYEKDRVLADGSFSFIPSMEPYFWSGITSDQLSNEWCQIGTYITIHNNTGVPLDAKGITLQFDDVYPVDFCLIDDDGSKVLDVTSNNQPIYINSDTVYTLATNLTLKITKLNKPYSRFRLVSLKFGVALSFGTDDIQSMTYKEQLQLISAEMYAADLSITVDNKNQRFNLDNPSSEMNFLEQAQIADATVSIALPNGMVETIKLGTFYLSDWIAKLDTATFKVTDIFNFMSGTYGRGNYRNDGISLYDLSIDVLTDAGLAPEQYVIDTYLKTIYVNNPMPVLSHKDALQLIANAGRCVLKQDRDGRVCMRAAFVPDTKLQSNDILPYANLTNIINGSKKEVYGTYEKDFIKLDGDQLFLPIDKKLNVGYISASLSDINCMYGTKPHILVEFEAPVSLYNINLLFGQNIASDFVITTYQGAGVVETIAFTSNEGKDFKYNYAFKACERLLITFIKSNKSLQRVYVDGISFSTITDKQIGYDDIKSGTLEGAKQERVKNLTVLRTIYTPSGVDDTQDIRVTKVAGDSPETVISFQEPMAIAKLLLVGVDVTQSISAWQATANLTVPIEGSTEYILQLKGRKLNKINQNLVFAINPTGCEKVVENALVSDHALAHDLGEWVADYLKADKEYSFDYWYGDASLDTNDIIHLENKYNDNLQVQIYSHELQIAGAITGKIKARKVTYDG